MGVIQQLTDEMAKLSMQETAEADPFRMQILLGVAAYMLCMLEEEYAKLHALAFQPPARAK